MKDVMIDLETLSLKPNAAILSIGAVAFDNNSIGAEFYKRVRFNTCTLGGVRHTDLKTIKWWLTQNDEAREEITTGILTLPEVLQQFNTWFKENNFKRVWSLGADFDIVILKSAYEDCNWEIPWLYKNVRCMRTLAGLGIDVEWEKPKIAHSAIEDARAQAITTGRLLTKLNIDLENLR